ncbi:hypothetical protein GGI07_000945 [Coemansia sp. Benny D115]|nr:hypothetical protein GGI07_000945 [Coemansia sp. Benny D115]
MSADDPTKASTAETTAQSQTRAPKSQFYPMHERDHYWPAGGIPPHRARDRHIDIDGCGDSSILAEPEPTPCLTQSLAADIEPAGALPDSAAIQLAGAATAAASATSVVEINQHDAASGRQQALKSSIAGAGAGCVSSVVTCPLDVVKTRLQYQGVLQAKYGKMREFRPYRGTWGTLRRISAEEGVRGLYRGLAPMLMGYLPTWGVYFTAYEALKRELPRYMPGVLGSTGVHVLSAMGAGATTSLLTNPIWVLKSRFMTQSAFTEYRYTSMRHAVQVIMQREGLRGFYKGLGSSLLGVTHVAVQFPLYERLKSYLQPDGEARQLEPSRILVASATSKMVASTVTYPHEVIRTRLQNQVVLPYKYRGILHAVALIYREEGMRAFYRGLSTNLIRTVPASMMTLLTYELLVRVL